MMASFADLVNSIRVLSIDAVEQARSGHPGMPMGMATIAETLWNDFLNHNPLDPNWVNRDRFILSNGHGSMLLYSLLHLTGYDLSLDEIKNFRQLHSKTPGHPEYGLTPGVETTTGPLGQGLANAVGMAIAEQQLAAAFNRDEFDIINHYTYVFAGDGCLMEGVSHEACSLAGTLGLDKLIVFWDDNGISIDGEIQAWCADDTVKRFESYNWHVIADVDGHNRDDLVKAIKQAQAEQNKPTLICCKTTIGFGSPKVAGTAKSHGAPLGADEAKITKENLGWPYAAFEIPDDIYQAWDARETGQKHQDEWQQKFEQYQARYPELATNLLERLSNQLPADFEESTKQFIAKLQKQSENLATRKASQLCINHFAKLLPAFLGGSADLTGSNLTNWADCKTMTQKVKDGNYIHYGVREFGMAAIMNGMALYGGFIPFGGTFLTFLDYARNAVRMSALMGQRVIYVFTHDSIGLGEDGPTHQPIEHLSILRLTPNLETWRPCDAVETAYSWLAAIENKTKPTALALSRQSVQAQARNQEQLNQISKGGYILWEPEQSAQAVVIATGSEVELAVQAAEKLSSEGIYTRVVSMPCVERFLQQDQNYKDRVLPANIANRVVIEAGATGLWYQLVGLQGAVIGIDRFGESAPAEEVYRYLGITSEAVMATIKQQHSNI